MINAERTKKWEEIIMKKGWYFNVGRKEYFVESNQQNKTKKFAEKILEAMKEPVTD